MNRLTALLLALMLVLPTMAQQDVASVKEAQKQINTIKRSSSYLYAETTMATEPEAYDGAKNILKVKIEDWLASEKKHKDATVFIAKAQNSTQQISTRRGDYYRVFLYVKKSDIFPVADTEDVIFVQKDAAGSQSQATFTSKVEEIKPQLTEVEKQMVAVESGEAIKPFIKRLEAEGQLADYGGYKNMPQQTDCYLFVYNRDHEVVAVIRQTGSTQTNLRTGREDNVRNYPNCGAIWLRTK